MIDRPGIHSGTVTIHLHPTWVNNMDELIGLVGEYVKDADFDTDLEWDEPATQEALRDAAVEHQYEIGAGK